MISVGSNAHQQVCACKQQVESVQVFRNTLVHDFTISETAFDDEEGMFHFATYGRFTSLDTSIPILSLIAIINL